jgi:mRNA interferase MazF
MIRGEVWTASGGGDYAGKPRPVVLVQSDRFPTGDSVTVCPFTTDPTDAPLLRLAILPAGGNGLRDASRIMVDKITTVPRAKLGRRIGRLSDTDMHRLERAILIFLGLAD